MVTFHNWIQAQLAKLVLIIVKKKSPCSLVLAVSNGKKTDSEVIPPWKNFEEWF